jgi:glycosidase
MDGNDGFYGAGAIMTTWIGNHDIPRPIHFASREITNCREGSNPDNGWNWRPAQPTAREPYERLGVAYAVMFTNPGIPLMYYGDEIGLAGGGDPDNRRMMPWTEGSLNEHQRTLREQVRALGRIRGAYPVLGRGRRVTVSSDADTWVYRMTGCGEDDVLVAINKADAARTVSIPAGSYEDLVDGGAVSGGSRELPARSFVILGTAP